MKIFRWVIVIVGVISWVYVFYNFGYKKGYKEGANYGFDMCLDTVNKIVIKCLNDSTMVGDFRLIRKDTVKYFISKKY
jgi:hypothetical protein